VPSDDAHIECVTTNIERSQRDLPYPKLDVFAQSLLDTYNPVDLADLIDGMDLQDGWGEQNLDLEGNMDAEWAETMNEKISPSMDYDEDRLFLMLRSTEGTSKREL
jgi:hypothetical protein